MDSVLICLPQIKSLSIHLFPPGAHEGGRWGCWKGVSYLRTSKKLINKQLKNTRRKLEGPGEGRDKRGIRERDFPLTRENGSFPLCFSFLVVAGALWDGDEGRTEGSRLAVQEHLGFIIRLQSIRSCLPSPPRASNIIKEFGCEGVMCALVCWLLAACCCCRRRRCCQSALQNQVAADGPRRR